jgi:hypothetical protein
MLPGSAVLCIELSRQAAAHLTNTESDWLRRAGVLIGVSGTILATPDGIASACQTAKTWPRRSWTAIKRVFAGGKGVVHAAAASGTVHISGSATAEAWRPWEEDASDSDKIDILHRQVEKLRDLARAADKAIGEVRVDLRRELNEVERRLGESHRRLAEDVQSERRHGSRVDARGFGPIALSIILTGISGELADIPAVGWSVLGIAVIWTGMAARNWWPDFSRALSSEQP